MCQRRLANSEAEHRASLTIEARQTPQSPTPPLPTRTNSNKLRSRTSSRSNDPTTNDDPPTNSWFKYAWQKLKKDPRGSQMFHSPPLIRALQMSKSETTAKISQETWNNLHIAHMCWDDYVTDAWNIFLKCYLCLRPKTDNPITIDFHDTWDALVKQNDNALCNRPGIGYLINHGRPSGL